MRRRTAFKRWRQLRRLPARRISLHAGVAMLDRHGYRRGRGFWRLTASFTGNRRKHRPGPAAGNAVPRHGSKRHSPTLDSASLFATLGFSENGSYHEPARIRSLWRAGPGSRFLGRTGSRIQMAEGRWHRAVLDTGQHHRPCARSLFRAGRSQLRARCDLGARCARVALVRTRCQLFPIGHCRPRSRWPSRPMQPPPANAR